MKVIVSTIVIACAVCLQAATNVVARLAILPCFEHQEDIDDFLQELSSGDQLTATEFSEALVEYGNQNILCRTSEERLGLIRAVNALADYGQTNSVPFLERVLREKPDDVCAEALPAYMRLAAKGRSVEFFSREFSGHAKLTIPTLKMIEKRLVLESNVTTNQAYKAKVVRFLADDDMFFRLREQRLESRSPQERKE